MALCFYIIKKDDIKNIKSHIATCLGLPNGLIFLFERQCTDEMACLLGCAIFTIAKLGQIFSTENNRLIDLLSIFLKSGFLIIAGSFILKAVLVIRQKEVWVAGIHVQGPAGKFAEIVQREIGESETVELPDLPVK